MSMTSGNTADATLRFCYGCNEKLAVSHEVQACPRCGQPLAPAELDSTLPWRGAQTHRSYADEVVIDVAEPNELVGRQLADYAIHALIGQGGMARVYRAEHRMLKRPCAVKVLSPELIRRQPQLVEMFFAEARAAAALVHPHVVTVHTIGEDEGFYFLEMELVVGSSLRRLTEQRGKLDFDAATRMMVQTSSALATAHRAGIVHRDVKPDNILINDLGVAKLADFGLAKQLVGPQRSRRRTRLFGTPYFMAPELFQLHPADPRSDVYAMGVTFFNILTGRFPFVDHTIEAIALRHANDQIPDLAQHVAHLPDDLRAIIARCLAKRPEQRYEDGGALHEDLRAAYGHLRDMETLIREALAGRDIPIDRQGDRFVIDVPLPGQRSQRVWIEAAQAEPIHRRLVKIYSVCAPVSASYFERALALNAGMAHGAIAIEELPQGSHFVIVQNYPRATCDPEEVRHSVLEIAAWADEIEHALTGLDRH